MTNLGNSSTQSQHAKDAAPIQLPPLQDASPEDMRHLIRKLQARQAELEQRNDEFRRRQVELEEAYDRYAELYDLAPIGCFTLDEDGVIVNVNLTATLLLKTTRDDLNEAPFSRFVAEESRAAFEVHRRQVLDTQTGPTCELTLVTKEGTLFYGQLDSLARPDVEDDSTHMWTIVADITARKQAEATLQQHARRLELLRKVDQAILSAKSPEVIAQSVVDPLQDLTSADRTSVLQFNFAVGKAIVIATQGEVPTELSKTRCLSLARYGPLAEYRSGHVHSVDDISDLPQPTPLEQTLQAEGVRAYLGVPLVEMDELLGLLILAWTQPSPVPAEHVEIAREVANQLAVVICQARLREQVEGHAEELEQQVAERTAELHRERKFVSAILDTTGVLVVVLDTEGRIIGFNRACEQNSGYSFGEVQDQQFGDFLLSPEVGAQLRPVFEKVQAGVYPQQFEGVWNTKDGRQRLISWSYNALVDQADVVEFIIGIGLDITERVQAEEENWRLYEALSLQHEQLRALTRQLADVQEVERQHISRQLHDRVGQRLSAIGFNLKFIETQISDAVPAAEPIQNRLADSLELVAETTNRIRELMAELRPPLLDDYGLAEALTWYADQFTARSEVRTEVHLQPLEPRLPASVENTLFRIAQEALTNVAKHARATTATISLKTDGQSVRLVIADDGVGFDPDHTASATNRQTWGFLTMTERAEMVGGLCRIESQSGRGTRVVVEVDRPQDVGGEQ